MGWDTWRGLCSAVGIEVGITVVADGGGSAAPACPSPPLDATLGQTLRARRHLTRHSLLTLHSLATHPRLTVTPAAMCLVCT
ncbi:hypothetical protein E2C01_090908 [Portunus trituberculatus]|uniref:Uncharacterized protein n=1 Tax=Portunus trituberculatus TaxID=210409 RepID=A0A5B7JN06_PORTR|nr:hypothetical protein [Portunus trituberculatus]